MTSPLPGSLTPKELAKYTAAQLNTFFPDPSPVRASELSRWLPIALERLAAAFAGNRVPRFHRQGAPFFNHLHSDQYAMYIYLLANEAGASEEGRPVATKLYLLNKVLHSIDAYFEIQLPRVFLFAHPIGTVLGRAQYADYFMVMQGCTVGNVNDVFPTFGRGVVLCAGSSVLGRSQLGAGVCVGAGTLLVNANISPHHTVVGRARGIQTRETTSKPMWQTYFNAPELEEQVS
jgi:serine O-acetyltransferase